MMMFEQFQVIESVNVFHSDLRPGSYVELYMSRT